MSEPAGAVSLGAGETIRKSHRKLLARAEGALLGVRDSKLPETGLVFVPSLRRCYV